MSRTASGVQAPVGEGFTVTPSDLAYILQQIKIAEAHVANTTSVTGPCGALVGTGPNQLPSPLLSLGLRTVDGSCNNLIPGQERFGAADELFPRLSSKDFRDAEAGSFGGPPSATSYTQKSGNVFDSQPRVISNLIVDQTSTNPAAVAAAGFPVRTQGNDGVVPCDSAGLPAGCVPDHETLFIPNVTTDVGLSPPFNSLFTLFGQFFDHGIDQTVKGGGTVYVPLKADDPLIPGPDHILGTSDDLSPNLRFMVLTRGQNQPGPDGVLGTADDVQDATNTDSPWVDQSQTYTSHPSHQVFVREYAMNASGLPVSTGKLLGGLGPDGSYPGSPDGRSGMATWAAVKKQAAELLGLRLEDRDVTNIPTIASDPYGKFIPGPSGLPQYVTSTGLVEGNLASPVPVPSNVLYFDTPFLTDIAHNADPSPQDTDHNPATPRVAPTPDADNVPSADFANQPVGTYDDEMLNAHFCAGDGRVNENIGLTAIHQVFHSEHDRLIDDIKHTLTNDTSTKGVAALAEWKLVAGASGWNGERLFQAARFVTEMEYQHLVFEEFARKIQPAINPFQPFAFTQTELNPAIQAEFAHAVYRFGHSMLTESISRRNEGRPGPDGEFGTADDVLGSENDISLLDGFLNPPAYTDGGAAGVLTSEEAAGSIFMGMADQTGNEIDEFVTDTLRNNLLGLPLDLPTINMTRARSEGVPPLNVFRKELFDATNDGQLKPYVNWVDFGENLKHPESLINFVAAYGQHPTILERPGPDGVVVDDPATAVDESADNLPPTLASRREAARLIVQPDITAGDVPPTDAAAFMNSVDAWANAAGDHSITGLDNIDLWVGGLAERTNMFGGLLGSTFNFVFEKQLTELQDGDRLYYLARTPGMNLRASLEGNSFAELVMRNTNAQALKADVFATADCEFELKKLAGTAAGFTAQGNTVSDDPDSSCNETAVLLRQPDGTIKYRMYNTEDPPGINGQSIYNGTSGVDRIYGGNDNDTFWGGLGNDIIEGGDGADVALGGEGDDIITDIAGDDVPKGGPGNDAIDAGPGLDIIMAGDGNDFTNGGANINETFAGEGNDFSIAGDGEDAVFGDGGDDWEEGGNSPDLLIGDSSNLFFLDNSQRPGHDVLIGQGGDDDYDMEGGDDIGLSGPGVEKIAGASGYDWEIGLQDPQASDMDLALPIAPLGILQVGVRDKFNEVEALSGGPFSDTLRGDDLVPSAVGGAGFIGCDVLDQAGLDRIAGLDPLVPTLNTPAATVIAASASGDCPLLDPASQVWGDGNILLGGAGNDLFEGRGGDDVIDGDRYLSVRLSIRTNPADPSTEIGSAAGMTTKYLRDSNGNLTGPTLMQAVFAGTVNPGNIVTVREVITPTAAETSGNLDTVLFSGPLSNYLITAVPASAGNLSGLMVVQTGADVVGQRISDGIDIVRNVERLQFTDQTVVVATPAAPVIGTATAGDASATVTWSAPAPNGSPAVQGYEIEVSDGRVITGIPATTFSRVINGLTNGTSYTFQVRAFNMFGPGPLSAPSNAVTPTAPVGPQITLRSPDAGATNVAVNTNVDAFFDQAMVAGGFNTATFRLTNPAGAQIAATVNYNATLRRVRLNPAANLAQNTTYTVTATGGPTAIRSAVGVALTTTSWTFTTVSPASTAPVVTVQTPAPGAVGVGRGANILVTFSEPVTGVSDATFVMTNTATGAVVPGVVDQRTATQWRLNPTGRQPGNTEFTITLTGGATAIRDLTNTPLVTTSWSFRTTP